MYKECMCCESKNLATLGGDKQVCLDCGWHSANMTLIEAARVILMYYENECEDR